MATFRPINDQVLVLRQEAEDRKGSIYVPQAAKDRPSSGTVVAVGRGKVTTTGHLIETTVKTGDKVLFGKYSGQEIEIDGVQHLIMREEEILGVDGP